MNFFVQHIINFCLLCAITVASGGATIYSHFCSTSNESYVSYNKTHCETEKEAAVMSCHKKTDTEPCCTDTPEFDTQDQYLSKFEFVQFVAFENAQIAHQQKNLYNSGTVKPTVETVLPRPPNLRACIRFQQFLS